MSGTGSGHHAFSHGGVLPDMKENSVNSVGKYEMQGGKRKKRGKKRSRKAKTMGGGLFPLEFSDFKADATSGPTEGTLTHPAAELALSSTGGSNRRRSKKSKSKKSKKSNKSKKTRGESSIEQQADLHNLSKLSVRNLFAVLDIVDTIEDVTVEEIETAAQHIIDNEHGRLAEINEVKRLLLQYKKEYDEENA